MADPQQQDQKRNEGRREGRGAPREGGGGGGGGRDRGDHPRGGDVASEEIAATVATVAASGRRPA